MSLLRKASIVTTPTSYENGKILSVKPSIVLGQELVTNGDFATNLSGWSIEGTNATNTITWESNGARIISTGANVRIAQNNLTIGKTYRLTCDVAITVGKIGLDGATSGLAVNMVEGFNEIIFTAISTTFKIKRITGNDNCLLDNVSVKEVIDADFDFTRNSSATRVNSQGLIEDMQILSGNLVSNGDFSQEGSELITNGDFATDLSGWNNGNSYWQWSSQGAYHPLGSVNNGFSQSFTTQSNKLTFSVEIISGVLAVEFGGVYTFNQSGVYTIYGTTGVVNFKRSGSLECYIDNVSVKEVGQDWHFTGETELTEQGGRIYSSSGSWSVLHQNNAMVIGNQYKLTFDVIATNGAKLSNLNGTNIYDTSTIGSKVFYITAQYEPLYFKRFGGITDVTISNIKIIEITDDTNLPRIDYTGGEGHWLFEPQSTNLETESAALTTGWSVVTGATSQIETSITPFGVSGNVYKLTNATNNPPSWGSSNILKKQYAVSATNPASFYTFSVYVKSAGSTTINIQLRDNSNGQDLRTGLIYLSSEWQRVTISKQLSTSTTAVGIVIAETDGDILLAGAQFEQQSYATSYIPTSGSQITRLADAANGAGSSDLINSTEGVLYAEIAALANDGVIEGISISDGTINNKVVIFKWNTSNSMRGRVTASGVNSLNHTFSVDDIKSFNKIAISYAENNFSIWLNGVEVFTDTSGAVPVGLNKLQFDIGGGGSNFYGKYKCVAVFKEALTDAELTCLTTI